MDELLNTYIDLNYTQELGYELLRSFQIFDHFNYKDIYERLNNLIMDAHNQDKSEVNDAIVSEVRKGQDFIFKAHGLVISDDASVENRNELLLALGLFMKLEDYEPVLTVLYSDAEDMEKFSSIITDICMLDEFQVYTMVQELDPDIFETMKKYIEGRTHEEELMEIGRPCSKCVDSIRDFKAVFGEDVLGVKMLEAGTLAGAPLSSYLPFVKNAAINPVDLKKSALNITSLLLLSSNGNNTPIITYKKYIDKFTDSLEYVQKLEPMVLSILTELENYRRAKNEQK